MSAPEVTVVIPTVGSPTLRYAVDSILPQLDTDIPACELLIVWSGKQVPPKPKWIPSYVRQTVVEELGLARAKNGGIEAARGRLVLFTEDDVYCLPGWIRALYSAWSGGIDVLGGPVRLRWPTMKPRWVTPNVEALFGAYDAGSKNLVLSGVQSLVGGNMGITREAGLRLGGFDIRLGHGGAGRLLGEDTELCRRAIREGYRVGYVPDALVEHRISPGNATRRNYFARMFKYGRSLAILDHGAMPPSPARIAHAAYLLVEALTLRQPTEKIATAAWICGSLFGTRDASKTRMIS